MIAQFSSTYADLLPPRHNLHLSRVFCSKDFMKVGAALLETRISSHSVIVKPEISPEVYVYEGDFAIGHDRLLLFTSVKEEKRSFHRNFVQTFLGNAKHRFIRDLRIYADIYASAPKVYYGRTIAMVQSSGTGKSRLMKDLGLEVKSYVLSV
jgi:hypothetical protein